MERNWLKVFSVVFLGAVITFLGIFFWFRQERQNQPEFGVTFSSAYAQELGLDERDAYRAVLDDLGVRLVRLPVYWSQIERERDVFDWQILDDLVAESERADAQVTLAIGAKVPRWPECYVPEWVGDEEFEQELFAFLREVVGRYRTSPAIVRWQVENEPFLTFGEGCPAPDPKRLEREIALVQLLDDRPVQLTVSGELESWVEVASMADVLGVSLYRQTWREGFGHFIYPLQPWFYRLHAQKAKPFVERIVISELQAEPWFFAPIVSRPLEQWYQQFDAAALKSHVDFAARTRMPEVYLWGVEWWYKLKMDGDARLWDAVKGVL